MDLWERVIVTPREKDAGFILSDQMWPVEVWSTFKRRSQPLTGVSISGPGGAVLQGPSVMVYYPNQAQPYTVKLAAGGDAVVANLISWTFTGVLGVDLAVSGSRITVFAYRPDWSEPYRKQLSWLTELMPGYDGSEQRRSLRLRPRYTLAFRVLTTDPLETATLEALLYGWQDRRLAVPIWPETTLLLSAVAPGATMLAADTANRRSLEVGGLIMIWSSFAVWEAFRVESIAPGSIGLGSETTKAWAPGARIVPLRVARFPEDQALGRPANWLTSSTFAFACEAV